MSGNKPAADAVSRAGDASLFSDVDVDTRADVSLDPEAQMIQQQTVQYVRRALESLPTCAAVVYRWESRKRKPSPVFWQRILELQDGPR